ncbi:hypothetical protein P167DRAFT_580424 [Morchella conica CCBAS932]|uniref:Uncharacterized protein n=1 Tax=Morchella conica CCBAS932 TaxID=1392247 RepID=A0A3N4KAW6_9PEZI|nr:hypothetical protein P167DRAFT_580424 [Morchella conica CCBAS932]
MACFPSPPSPPRSSPPSQGNTHDYRRYSLRLPATCYTLRSHLRPLLPPARSAMAPESKLSLLPVIPLSSISAAHIPSHFTNSAFPTSPVPPPPSSVFISTTLRRVPTPVSSTDLHLSRPSPAHPAHPLHYSVNTTSTPRECGAPPLRPASPCPPTPVS